MGGMGLWAFLGVGTPLTMVSVIEARPPSPHSQVPAVRSGPMAVPLPAMP